MEPELQAQVKQWDKEKDPEVAKRLLIRDGAMRAYKEGNIGPIVQEALTEINSMISVLSMAKSEVGSLIGALERGRHLLASVGQGLSIAHAEEIEPQIRTKRENEEVARRIKKASGTKENPLKDVDLAGLLAYLQDKDKKPPAETSSKKYICDKCNTEVWISMKSMHKC